MAVDTDNKPCPVCGFTDSNFLFDKESDGRGDDKISLNQCVFCDSVFLAKYKESYDNDLYAYYQRYQGREKSELYDQLTRNSYKKVLELIASHSDGMSILDVGCGKGDFVDAALHEGFKVDGIELAQPAVDIAQRFGLPVAKMDFFSSTIEERSRDVVTMFEVIEHLPDPVSFFRRAEAVLRPGGLIYMTTPNYNSLDRRILGSKWDVIHREHLIYFTPATLLAAIRKTTGLKVLHIETRNLSGQLISHFENVVRRSKPGNSPINLLQNSLPRAEINFRSRISSSLVLSMLKRGVNSLLNLTSLGSTIVILLKRPE